MTVISHAQALVDKYTLKLKTSRFQIGLLNCLVPTWFDRKIDATVSKDLSCAKNGVRTMANRTTATWVNSTTVTQLHQRQQDNCLDLGLRLI